MRYALAMVAVLVVAFALLKLMNAVSELGLRQWEAVPRDGLGPAVGPFWTRTGAACWCAADPERDYTVRRRP